MKKTFIRNKCLFSEIIGGSFKTQKLTAGSIEFIT